MYNTISNPVDIQLFAESTAEETTEEEVVTEEGGTDEGAEEEQTEESKSYTKAELSKMMDQAVAKGRRLGKKDALKEVADKPAVQDNSEPDPEKEAQLNARIQKANEKMLQGTAMGLATEVGLTAKGIKAATRLYSDELTECFDANDDLIEDDVKDVLLKFAEEYPEFKVVASDAKLSTPYSKNSGGSKVTPEDKLAKALGIKR